jgi:hypothetical protein
MSETYLDSCVRILCVLVEEYTKTLPTDKIGRTHLRKIIGTTIRLMTDHHLITKVEWSTNAQLFAKQKNIPCEKLTWNNQTRYDPGRKELIYEHMTTVSNLRDSIIKNPQNIKTILQSSRVVWITRAENNELTRLGFNSKRPDPELAYRTANIVLV